jgi:lipopolysaccharide O-acetyltransferase
MGITDYLKKQFNQVITLDGGESVNMIRFYGVIGLVRLFKNWLLTRILFPSARLVRFPIYVRGRSAMKLAEGLTTGVNVRLDAFAPYGSLPVLHIGRHVQINDSVHIGAIERVVIGDHTLIASRVFISDHNHGNYQNLDAASAPDIPPADRPLSSRPVYIGSNVWLGEQVCILPGVTIGDGAIVGANSVVTRDVPPNSIAAGNPARVVRVFDSLTQTWKKI